MSNKKEKPPPGIGNSSTFRNDIGHSLPLTNSHQNKTNDNSAHSRYYLFDDEDDFTTLGRNISEYIAPKKSGDTPGKIKGNTIPGSKSA